MATTLQNLIDRARQRTDKENSTYVTDAELTAYINASYAELYDILISSYEDYFITGPTSFTLTSSDSGVYSLPADFYKLKGVDFQSGGEWLALHTYNWNTRNFKNRTINQTVIGEFDLQYRIIGSNLRIEPDDNAVGTYQLWYIPAYTALASTSDEIDSVISRNNWEEYIVIDTSIKILAKEESSTAHLLAEKNAMTKRIVSMTSERDVDQPERISDVRSHLDYNDL